MTTHPHNASRRTFIKSTAAAIGGASLLLSGCSSSISRSPQTSSIIQKGDIVLFQGDSITDDHRDKGRQATPNDTNALGRGYVYSIATELLTDRAGDDLKIFNTGISGNKVYQLAERWDKDCIAFKPNVLSILIGVNDFWHMHKGTFKGTLEKYETDYRALLNRTLKALPDVRLIICEPFVLRCGVVDDTWLPEFDEYRTVARKLATEFKTVFVPFQDTFNEAAQKAAPTHWLRDGVHPTPAGACLMAREWIKVVNAC